MALQGPLVESEINRNGHTFVQAVVQEGQAQLKQAQIAAVRPMDDLLPPLEMAEGTKVDHPDVGQAGGDQQPGQALRSADVALVQMKAATFLVGKEGFNTHALAIPAAGFFDQVQVGDQVNGLSLLLVPPEDDEHRAIALPREQHIFERQATARPDVNLVQSLPGTLLIDLGALGGATHIVPVRLGQKSLQLNTVELAVAQQNQRNVRRQQVLELAQQVHMRLGWKMTFAPLDHDPQQRNGPFVVDQADHQRQAVTSDFTAIDSDGQGAVSQTGQQLLDKRQHVQLVSHPLVLVPARELLFTAGHFGPRRRFLGDRAGVRALAGDDAVDEHRQHVQRLQQV